MGSKYVDTTAIINVIGCIYKNPRLLELTDKYKIIEEDFPDEFHRTVFGSIYKIYELGSQTIDLITISDFLSSRPKAQAVYKTNDGDKWLLNVSEKANPLSFDYYYNRMKKMTLLRAYDNCGVDVSDIYDPDNILDMKKKQLQEDILDNSSLVQIANKIDDKIDAIKMRLVGSADEESVHASTGIRELIQQFKKSPEVGLPLYGPLINSIHRGARLKKFYLRSAASGVGKTRALAADAAYIACNEIYDSTFGWIKNGICQPTCFIVTEQDLQEAQTLLLAFLSDVDEDHILTAKYVGDEEERVEYAAGVIERSQLYINTIPDFNLTDIENIIKKNIREHNVTHIFFDYIQSTMKIFEEIGQRSGGTKLREDNILFMLSTRLKDICNIYGVFLESSTQLSGDWKNEKIPDQSLLRGAKSLADKIDVGEIMLRVTAEDLEALQPILDANIFDQPVIKISVYKNRRGRYNSLYLWCKGNLGTCRIEPMFATTYDYDLIQINDLKILTEAPGAFEE